jgi:hypothetical protein
LIPSGISLTLLRDPVDTFESGYVYLGLQKGYRMDINEFAEKRARLGATRLESKKERKRKKERKTERKKERKKERSFILDN